MAERVPYLITVLMNGRDVTKWVTAWSFSSSSGDVATQWSVTFAGWHNVEVGARWDIYESYNAAEPRAQLRIRGGRVPPDRQPTTKQAADGVTMTVNGYDAVHFAGVRRPRQTLVMVAEHGEAAAAISKYGKPIGKTQIVTFYSNFRVKQVVEHLGSLAGFNVEYRLENWPCAPFVVPPERSYWSEMLSLVEPYAPEMYYRPEVNTVVIAHPADAQSSSGFVTDLSSAPDVIASVSGLPSRRRRVNRVLVSQR